MTDDSLQILADQDEGVCKEQGIKTLYIEPGSPWQNGFIESFHARSREDIKNRSTGEISSYDSAEALVEDGWVLD